MQHSIAIFPGEFQFWLSQKNKQTDPNDAIIRSIEFKIADVSQESNFDICNDCFRYFA